MPSTITDEAPVTTESDAEPVTVENLMDENRRLKARIRWLSDCLVEQDRTTQRMLTRIRMEVGRG